MKADSIVWEMEKGIVTALKYNGIVFRCNGEPTQITGRPPAISKWVEDLSIGRVFTLQDFFKDHPHLRYMKVGATDRELSRLCGESKLLQLGNDKFKVMK